MDLKELDLKPLHFAKLTHIAEKFLVNIGQTSSNTQMSELLQQNNLSQMEFPLASSAAASHVKTSHLQEKVLELLEKNLDYGKNTQELLAKYDHNTSSWKTSQLCFTEDYQTFSETWPRSGMMQNGIAYQLVPLELHTKETECGLLPTPTASPMGSNTHMRKNGTTVKKRIMNWPTPTAHNAKEGAYPAEYLRNTPTLSALAGGKLNPTWIEWLMGFPNGWTDLELLETP